jgi:DNA repair exonuclease SbcCD ATPase subunit
MSKKSKQDVLEEIENLNSEIRELALEKNKIIVERDILTSDIRTIYENLGEARARKEEIEKEIKTVEREKNEITRSFTNLVNETREAMHAIHEHIQSGIGALQSSIEAMKDISTDLSILREQKRSMESDIAERRRLVRATVKDLDVYAERLTKAYEMNLPRQKIVIGNDKQQVIEQSKLDRITVGVNLNDE